MKKILAMILLALPIFAAPLFAQRTAMFPRFASGGGWTTELFFTNQGFSTVLGITVNFYDVNGAALSVTSNLGTNSFFTFNLAGGATQAIRLTSGTTFVEGYVLIDYPSFDSPVRGSQIYRYEQNGVVSIEVGLPQQEQGDHFSFPIEIDPSQRIYPAVGLTNPMSVAQMFVVNLVKTDGTIQSTATVEMAAGQHRAGYIDSDWLFPSVNNSTFTGTISVSSPLGAGVMTLRQDKDAFGGISTDGGPVMVPAFTVTNIFASDADGTIGNANDAFENAQAVTLPVQVSGSIGYADDFDIYSFNGQAGQILTAICDTTQLASTSYTDSVLQVYDTNWNQIAYNDQNGLAPGLYPQNDSFIQMQLPSTGTYYVVVSDFYNDVGDNTNYKYALHLRVR